MRRLRTADCGLIGESVSARRAQHIPTLLSAAVLAWSPLAVSAQASAYVPVDDPVYAYVAAVQARGGMRSLWALERPYTVEEIVRAMDAESAGSAHASWMQAILTGLARYEPAMEHRGPRASVSRIKPPERDAFHAAVSLDAFLTAETTGRRELMAAGEGDPGGIYRGFAGRIIAGTGNVVAVGRLITDTRLRNDPEFAGRKDRSLIGRSEDGYVLAGNRFAQLAIGRMGRDWGPAHVGGIQLGTAPATYDQLYGRLGGSRVRLSGMVARLSDYIAPTGDTVAQRFVAAHRLAFRFGSWEIAGTESIVYGGPGESIAPALTNPLVVFHAAQYNENSTGNVQVGLDVQFRARRFGQYSVQFMLDDVQVDDCSPACEEPTSWGATISAEGVPLIGAERGFASYTRLTNLAYRTSSPYETYSHLDVGLGRAFTDYDEWRVGIESALVPALPVRVYWARRRQGEGDYRVPFPAPAQYASTPAFLAGVVTVVNRFAVRGALITEIGDVEGDVGFNVVRNDGHVAGKERDGFEGRVRLAIRPRWLWRLNEGGS